MTLGSFAGMRVNAALRPFLNELGRVTLPSTVVIPQVQNAGFAEDGSLDNERVGKNLTKMCEELQWYVQALQQKKDSEGYPN